MAIAWGQMEGLIGHMTAEETMDLFEYLWTTIFSDNERELFIQRHSEIRDMLPEED